MTRIAFFYAAILLLVAHPARADALTVGTCLQIRAGLASLDSYTVTGKDEKPVQKYYKLSGDLRFKIAQMISALTPFSDATDRAKMSLMISIGNGKKIEDNSPELGKLNEEYQKIIDQPCNVDLPKIKLSDLKLGDDDGMNPIPVTVLNNLMPVIESPK